MYYVYILKSLIDGKVYRGYTSDLRRRLKEHLRGEGGRFTKKFKGKIRLVYYEAYRSKEDAIEREQKLRQHKKAYAQLRKRIQRSLNES